MSHIYPFEPGIVIRTTLKAEWPSSIRAAPLKEIVSVTSYDTARPALAKGGIVEVFRDPGPE